MEEVVLRMKTEELFYPEISAEAGGYAFNKAVEAEVYSDQDSYFDWGKIRFTPEFQPKLDIPAKEKGAIMLGYDGVLEEVFAGYVSKPFNGGYMNEIVLKDKVTLLEETDITNTFLYTTPQEIISFCLARSGATEYRLSPAIYPARKYVPIYRKNVIAVIKELHTLWGINEKFFFSGGVFYWGEKPEQDQIYQFEYGVNIISLTRPLRLWELETVSAPFVKHSHKISLIHPKVSGEFEVKKVVFKTNDTGFIRTYINF